MQVEIGNLPDGWTLLEVCCVIKAIDHEGIVRLAQRFSPGLNTWEALGMLKAVAANLIEDMNRSFEEGTPDDA